VRNPGYLGDTLTPPSLHRYLYAYANPLRYIDLNGYQNQDSAEDLAKRYLKTRQAIAEITNWQDPGPDYSDMAGRAGSAAVKALTDADNYGEAFSQVQDVFKTAFTRPGDVVAGMFMLPEIISRQLKEGLTQGYELFGDWGTMSPVERQQRMDTLVERGVVTVLREGILILTVKGTGKTVVITMRKVDDTRWTIARMRTHRAEIILEREAQPAVGSTRVTRRETAALNGGADSPALSTGIRSTAEGATGQSTPPMRMRQSIVQDSDGNLVVRYEPEVGSNAASNRGLSNAAKGEMGEAAARQTMIRAGYQELPARLPANQGMDGVFVKYGADGAVQDIIITESKYSSTGRASLVNTKRKGRQLSSA